MNDGPLHVMAGLGPAIHVFAACIKKDVDARDISAFTRVFDALWAGHDESRVISPFISVAE
jgi:hypothetical protein